MRWLLLALWSFAASLGVAQAAVPAVVALEPGQPGLQAQPTAWLDSSGTATLAQAQQATARFQPTSVDDIQPLGPRTALWLHYRLQRGAEDRQQWLLAVASPLIDRVVLWQQDGRGRWVSQAAGDTVAVDDWPEAGRYPVFRLDLPPGQVRDIYVQVHSLTPTSLPVRIAPDSVHAQHIQLEYLGLGLTIGALLLVVAACVAQAWVYRDAVHAWYAVYALMTTLGVAAYTGVAAHWLWPFSGFWADTSQGTFALLFGGAALLFVRNLTGIEARHRVLDGVTRWAGIAGFALAAAYVLLPRPQGLPLMTAYVAASTLLNLAVAGVSWRRGDEVAGWVLAALAPQAFAVSAALLRVIGVLPVSFVTHYAVVVAMALEVPLLLVALSIRSRERHGAQIREQALSTQDALTGLLAPHLFHDRLRQVVSRYKRDKDSAAVIFIDLVNHRWIKNYYGAAVAEQSLLRSVIKLRRLLRDVDTVSRIGEARFGVILEGMDSRVAVTDRGARLIAAGLMPLKGLKPDVTLQFHLAAVLLDERVMEAPDLVEALGGVLARMSPRTRRPIRFLDPEETLRQPLAPDSSLLSDEELLQPQPPGLAPG